MAIYRQLKKKIKKIFYGSNYVLARYKGLTMMLRASNTVDREILGGGEYETKCFEKAITLINSKKVDQFIDIGANIGIYSLRIANECPEVKRVIAIEAQIENYNQLCANIRLNNFDHHIEAYHIGASDSKKEVEFLVNRGSSTGTSRVLETAPESTKMRKFNQATISVDTVDNILGEIKDQVLFFKIDVEGHERNVLLGMEKILASNHCFFQIEILNLDQKTVVEGLGLKQIDSVNQDMYFESCPNF